VNSFGCTDCKCKSHLFHIRDFHFLQKTMQVVHPET
jgi:Uri superfamily endonuclease